MKIDCKQLNKDLKKLESQVADFEVLYGKSAGKKKNLQDLLDLKKEIKKLIDSIENQLSSNLERVQAKLDAGRELNKMDLRFLYGFEYEKYGRGYEEDDKLKQILEKRNKKQDLAFVLDCKEDEISLTTEEALSGGIVFHYGDLMDLWKLQTAEDCELPMNMSGTLHLGNVKTTKGLRLPQYIGGDLYLGSLVTAEDLVFPKIIGGQLSLRGLETTKGLNLPKYIGGCLDLVSLETAGDLELPDFVGGDVYLNNLPQQEKQKLREKYPNLKIK